ncbi:hypothetical protein ACFZAV_27355 [Streptomyces sp. NPDC008343]|uniref:hypothetical protein n=1 Tax=Streptomyces sp. NPDC008343 TaxID=3364828 RepID=UPI0036E61E0C
MARTYQALAAAACAVVVLVAAGCSSDSGSDKSAKGKSFSDSAAGGSAGGDGKDSAKQQAPNGVEKLSAKEIYDKALAATEAAPTMRLVVPGAVDLTMDRKGNCAGTVTSTVGSPQEVLRKNDQVWAKPKDEAAYYNSKEGKEIIKVVPDAKGKYMHGTTDGTISLGILSLYCEIGKPGALKRNNDAAKVTREGRTTVDGQNAVSLKVTSSQDVMTVHVATEGEPYILKGVQSKDGETSEMTLSDFGKPFTPPATPPANQTFDAAKVEEAMMGSAGAGSGLS